jgi:hypothetical protein
MADGIEKLRDIFSFVCFALGIAALILCLFQAWNGQVKSATALGVVFLACAVFVFFTKIKMFKIWEVQVELREQLDEAQAVITRLRRISTNSARSAYMQVAWGNRMGSPSSKEKAALLEEVNHQLAELNLSQAERDEITKPVVRIIGFDLYQIFARTVQAYAGVRYSLLVERARSNDLEQVEERERHSAGMALWTKREQGQNPFERLNTYDLKTELERETPRQGEWLSERELELTRKFAQKITTIYAGCVAKGGYTPEAVEFLDRFQSGAREKFEDMAKEIYASAMVDLGK